MKLKYLAAGLVMMIAGACNNEAAVDSPSDSARKANDTSMQQNLPNSHNMNGGDSVPSPETQADTSNSVRK